jgi:hypothetical protein
LLLGGRGSDMPTTIGLTPRTHCFDRTRRSDTADGPFPLLAFSFTGLSAELLALLGSNDGAWSPFISFVLIAAAPALAAAVALRCSHHFEVAAVKPLTFVEELHCGEDAEDGA